jgi:glycine dehydrogenase
VDSLGDQPEFARRHIGPDEAARREMLRLLGYASLDALIDVLVPPAIRRRDPLALPTARSEARVLSIIRQIANKNRIFRSYLGMGYSGTYLPSVIRRCVLENPAWYTAYTPYQPEISQGRLEALLNFQTMVSELTGMDVANASLLDEATAAAEAMALCRRSVPGERLRFIVSLGVHPQTLAVVRTRAKCLGIEVVVTDDPSAVDANVFGVLVQYPNSTGAIVDHQAIVERAHAVGALAVFAADVLSLCMLTPPGELGADVVIGTTQRFGVPLGYGGPHAAYFACRDEFKREMPGRLVGVSIDAHGNTAYRLALQTREQHIRREKATSNICTAQVLLAVLASMYAVYHGPDGLKRIAERVHERTVVLAEGLQRLGWSVLHDSFFDTIMVAAGDQADAVHARALAALINLRRIDARTIGIALDETTSIADVEELWRIFADAAATPTYEDIAVYESPRIPANMRRKDPPLQHPVFRAYHSETEMLRYLRSLSDKDLALDRTMIPLGSCTMKLNAAIEMLPITWPEFADMHPYAPADQAKGYREIAESLEHWLCEITGYDAVSLQPNSGAQGEFAGLLAIRAYHHSRGEDQRKVVLIPRSAHGTNPASARMAGFEVVIVACDECGNVDLTDLRAKLERVGDRLAALMVTYPSTHGVFEEAIVEICELVHARGGQVYLDGANLNALVGLAAPGKFGADVSHLNLHKTFCIPHGGGGPGVGPIGVRAHLAPFLPSARVIGDDDAAVGPVSAAPLGSAGILPISWSYIALMGADGLTEATRTAILSANYIAKRLEPYYPILYTGRAGLVAHECILDLRPIRERCGINVDDVAKRLIDYGFHAPTMSFPVAGTLMIEPTESESKRELDRFCEAMIAIREEIAAVEDGRWDRKDNPLRNAPHTIESVSADEWTHPYSREVAAYPLRALRAGKYWSPVGRVDNAYGDRHLICACPPMEEYEG